MVELKNLLLSLAGTGAVVLSTSSVILSTEGTLKEIEIYFYDKSGNNGKQIKIDLDVIETGGQQFKIKESDNKWVSSEKISSQQEIPMYRKLFEIAQQYIKTQHYLNLIKATQPEESSLTPNCTDKEKCCCKDGKNCQGDCSKPNCCSLCLCCYSDNADKQKCCTKKGTDCKWDKFKKTQKTFRHLSKNLLSYYYDSYLNAVQSHIKLTDLSFDDLKNNTESKDAKTKKEYKTFIGTLTYGFVNYSYAETKFQNGMLPKDNESSQYESLETSKTYYFSNIPQSFKFEYFKKSESSGDSSSDETTEPKNNISKVVEQLSDLKQAQDKYKTPSTESSCCCESDTGDQDIIPCLLGRSFVFKTEGLDDVQNKIKNGKECCASKA